MNKWFSMNFASIAFIIIGLLWFSNDGDIGFLCAGIIGLLITNICGFFWFIGQMLKRDFK